MKKLCYVATIPAVVHAFLRGHIQAAADKYEVTVICNFADKYLLDGLNARLVLLPIERKPSPWRDMLVLFRLFNLFRREHFDIVHSIMPKTGMLSMLSAWLTRVPTRIHHFTGQVWVNKRGWTRGALKMFDKLIVSFSTHILVDSSSQLDFLVSERILTQRKGMVIGHGSICGVDPDRFYPNAKTKRIVRQELAINQSDTVLLFLGRLNRDKGMLDLAAAFAEISRCKPKVVLLLVGAEEDVPFMLIQKICGAGSDRLRRVCFTPNPERYMAAADIFCLPSYREGFGQGIIEAAASGLPTVASRIYGITDAVADGLTGLLFPAGDVGMLTKSLLALIEDQSLRHKMGMTARVRALKLFARENVTKELMDLYERAMVRP